MKKLYLPLIPLLCHLFLSAQSEIAVLPGTDLYLPPGTVFSTGGLVLIPSADFTLNGVELTKNTTVSHTTLNNYVSRVYNFSNTSAPFTGTVQFFYSDAELNGLSEPSLTVNIHDGNSWQPVNSITNDVTDNYVLTGAFANRSLNELALGDDAFTTLPLQWGTISAYRQSQIVKIDWTTRQESNVSHFAVERTEDGRNWSLVADHISATNTLSEHYYSETDNSAPSSRLFYRVKQTDIDGRATYSPVAMVAAESEASKLVLYPNPVLTGFQISNIPGDIISRVHLYSNNGMLVKTWVTAQSYYDIHDVASGIYHVRLEMKNGTNQYFKINISK